MTDEQREEKRTYSWLLPAPGTSPDYVTVEPPMEEETHQEAAREVHEGPPISKEAAHQVPGPVQHPNESRQVAPVTSHLPPRSPEARRSTLSISRLGSIMLLAWSALAGAGEVVILVERGRTMAFRAGLLGLVWVAVAVAIWFFSMRAAKSTADSRDSDDGQALNSRTANRQNL